MELSQIILEYTKVLIWPIFAFACLLLFREGIIGLLPRLKNAELPGGVKFDFQEAIEQAQQIKQNLLTTPKSSEHPARDLKSFSRADANARMTALGLRPSPSNLDIDYYRALASQDPNIALAGLRLELETMGRNLADGFKINLFEREYSVLAIFRKLLDRGAISDLQFQLLKKVIELCNAAIHGTRVTKDQANSILDTAKYLADDYISWLSWGFSKNDDA